MKLYTPTPEEKQNWDDWVASRPPVVQAIAERVNAWTLYRMKKTDQLVTIVSISEDGTIKVMVWWERPHVITHINGLPRLEVPFIVFGVHPDEIDPAGDGVEIPDMLREEIILRTNDGEQCR